MPAIRADDLDDARIRAFMITDNRLTEISDWDDALLAENFKFLSYLDLDFDLEVTGFQDLIAQRSLDWRVQVGELGFSFDSAPA